MTVVTTTSRRRAATVGASTLLATGALHAVIVAIGLPVSPEEERAREVMAATHTVVAGVDRSLWQLFLGFSLTMALFIAALGALSLVVLRRAPGIFLASNAALGLDLAVSLGAFAVALAMLPAPPIVLLAVAAVAFAFALTRPKAADPRAAVERPAGRTSAQPMVTS